MVKYLSKYLLSSAGTTYFILNTLHAFVFGRGRVCLILSASVLAEGVAVFSCLVPRWCVLIDVCCLLCVSQLPSASIPTRGNLWSPGADPQPNYVGGAQLDCSPIHLPHSTEARKQRGNFSFFHHCKCWVLSGPQINLGDRVEVFTRTLPGLNLTSEQPQRCSPSMQLLCYRPASETDTRAKWFVNRGLLNMRQFCLMLLVLICQHVYTLNTSFCSMC